MTCAEANQIDLVDYLNALGYQAKKISRHDYWYLSPLREEQEASFKVNRNKNVWYDHGEGQGGSVIDFARAYFKCDVSSVLQKLSEGHFGTGKQNYLRAVSFAPQPKRNERNHIEAGIQIITALQPVSDLRLCRYIRQRRIDHAIASQYLHEVHFQNGDHEKTYKALGLKNSSGGYELRNEYFKGSSSPKDISFLDNNAATLSVFEGFFDFLSYQTIICNQEMPASNFMVLNSLSFFEKKLSEMCRHQTVNLYLDHDGAGRKCTEKALTLSDRFCDQSRLYKGYKDLNEWVINFGRAPLELRVQAQGRKM